MLKHIRPHKLFGLLEAEGPERLVTVRLSKRRGLEMATNDAKVNPDVADYSLRYLETMILLAVLKLTEARTVLEFGTHLGSTTLNIALNLPKDGVIYTLDLMSGKRFKEWTRFPVSSRKIVSIPDQDSSQFEFGKLRFDFIWIDGNPDRSDDTRNAFNLIDPGKLSCIGWHDYGSPLANTTETVESLEQTVYHIEDTAVCFFFNRELDL